MSQAALIRQMQDQTKQQLIDLLNSRLIQRVDFSDEGDIYTTVKIKFMPEGSTILED